MFKLKWCKSWHLSRTARLAEPDPAPASAQLGVFLLSSQPAVFLQYQWQLQLTVSELARDMANLSHKVNSPFTSISPETYNNHHHHCSFASHRRRPQLLGGRDALLYASQDNTMMLTGQHCPEDLTELEQSLGIFHVGSRLVLVGSRRGETIRSKTAFHGRIFISTYTLLTNTG